MQMNGENEYHELNGEKLAGSMQMDRRFMFMKIFWAQGVVCPCPWALYMDMTIIFKHLVFGNCVANQSQSLCGAS